MLPHCVGVVAAGGRKLLVENEVDTTAYAALCACSYRRMYQISTRIVVSAPTIDPPCAHSTRCKKASNLVCAILFSILYLLIMLRRAPLGHTVPYLHPHRNTSVNGHAPCSPHCQLVMSAYGIFSSI